MWGSYRVVQSELPDVDPGDEPDKVSVVSPHGHTIIAIKGDTFDDCALVHLGKGLGTALLVMPSVVCSGGGGPDTLMFVQHHGIRNIGIIANDRAYPGTRMVDGYPDLIADSSQCLYDFNLFFYSYPDAPIIYSWNGRYYEKANRRHPSLNIARARQNRIAYLADLKKYSRDVGDSESEVDTRKEEWYVLTQDVESYYVNLGLIGKSNIAYKWIMLNTSESVREWFLDSKDSLDHDLYHTKFNCYQSDQKNYDGDQIDGQFCMSMHID
jgi:hypothetical protein